MEAPEWYLLDRNTIESCVSFAQDADHLRQTGIHQLVGRYNYVRENLSSRQHADHAAGQRSS